MRSNPQSFENVMSKSQNNLFKNYQQFSDSILGTGYVCLGKHFNGFMATKPKQGPKTDRATPLSFMT